MDFSSELQFIASNYRHGIVPVKTPENKVLYENSLSFLRVSYLGALRLFNEGSLERESLVRTKSMYIEFLYHLPLGIIENLFGNEGVSGDPENKQLILSQIIQAEELSNTFNPGSVAER